jgi:chromosome segregation ATPase
MTDQNTLMQLAKLQTQVRNLEEDNKRYSKKLIERDEEIHKLKLEIQSLKDELLFTNHKLKKEGTKDETKTTSRRKK